jgi:hypothetical protein
MTQPHCATAARARLDPLPGTAAPARRWLLVEYPGPWAPQALQSRLIPPPLAERLSRVAREASARVLLIRRPGRRPRSREHRWAVVDHAAGQHWGTWRDPVDLGEAADLLSRAGSPPGLDRAGHQEPLLLVCVHGLHDTCCAVRGRPVASALADRWPDQTWECSHVGGDRFAANLLVLPDGACYGNLSAASARTVAADHLAGRVSPEHLRGLSTEPPVVQAAIVAAHARLGPAGAGHLVGRQVTALGADSWRVRLSGSGPMPAVVEATVSRGRRPPARLTCHAAGDSTAYNYEATDVRACAD